MSFFVILTFSLCPCSFISLFILICNISGLSSLNPLQKALWYSQLFLLSAVSPHCLHTTPWIIIILTTTGVHKYVFGSRTLTSIVDGVRGWFDLSFAASFYIQRLCTTLCTVLNVASIKSDALSTCLCFPFPVVLPVSQCSWAAGSMPLRVNDIITCGQSHIFISPVPYLLVFSPKPYCWYSCICSSNFISLFFVPCYLLASILASSWAFHLCHTPWLWIDYSGIVLRSLTMSSPTWPGQRTTVGCIWRWNLPRLDSKFDRRHEGMLVLFLEVGCTSFRVPVESMLAFCSYTRFSWAILLLFLLALPIIRVY